MEKLIIFLIRVYQKVFSRATGALPAFLGLQKETCAFYPSCSEYAALAIKKHGALRGVGQSALRILRCHPWQRPKVDLVK